MGSADRVSATTVLAASALAAGAALLAIPLFVHNDDGDAHLYRVVVRHLVEDRSWIDLRYLPNVFPRFREHLPFGFWPFAAAVRVFGEGALTPLALCFGVGTLALTVGLGRKLLGPWGAVSALLMLALCETFWDAGGRARLDPPLVLLSNLAAAPILLGPKRWTSWAWAFAFGAAGAMVKGPFGLVPLAAACLARGALGEWRVLFTGGAVTALATLPVIAFLVNDKLNGAGTWWSGYVEAQLLASAVGSRFDGDFAFYVPFRTLVNRFWPGLPLVGLGAIFAVLPGSRRPQPFADGERLRTLRLLGLYALFMLLILCLPSRKLWFHALGALPGLALFAGAAAAPWLERWAAGSARRPRWAAGALASLAVLLWGANATGLSRHLTKKPYVHCLEFGPLADRYPERTQAVIIGRLPWHNSAAYAAERRWDVRVEMTVDPTLPVPLLTTDPRYADFRVALVADEVWTGDIAGWKVLGAARGWRFLERD